MEKLLFESKGVTKKYKLVNTICSIVMVFSGVFMLLMRNMKRGTVGVSTYAGGRLISTGNLGGGYELSDSGRNIFMIIGLIFIVLGILFFFNMFSSNKSYVKIYDNRIVGLSCAGIILFTINKNYDIAYEQIEDIQIIHNSLYGDFISIKAHGERYGIIVKEGAEEVFNIINQKINETKNRKG